MGNIDGDDNDDTRIKPMMGSKHADTAQISIIGDDRVPVAFAQGKAGYAAEPHTCSDCGGTVASGNGRTACVNCGLEHHPGSAAFDEATVDYTEGERRHLPEMPNRVDFQAIGDGMNMTATGEGRRFMTDDKSASDATDFSYEGATGFRGTPTFKNIPLKGLFQRSENPMDMAWRLLKEELTPEQEQKLEEMATSGAGFAVEEMRNTFLEQNRIAQQQQPQMTPEMQSKYQDPLNAIKQKKEQEMRIRAAMKGSRLNNPRVKQMLEEFYNQHGHYPRHTPKSLRRK